MRSDDLADLFGGRTGMDDEFFIGTISSGVLPLDHALGGGWAVGRMCELFGNYSSGKTMVLLATLATHQKNGGIAIYIPTEGDYNIDFYIKLGGDPEKLVIFADEGTIENVIERIKGICQKLIKERKDGKDYPTVCIGWDGIAATSSKHLQAEGMKVKDMTIPQSLSQGCKLLTPLLKESRSLVVATNQLRDTINTHGPAEDTPGGRAWKFHISQRVELKYDGGQQSSKITIDDTVRGSKEPYPVGRWLKGCVVKNKLASPLAKFWLPIYTESGFNHPKYKGRKTEVGIDLDDALFEYYVAGGYFVPPKDKQERVVQGGGSGGWYYLHPSIDPEQKKFRDSDWPKKLEQFPQLRTLLQEDQSRVTLPAPPEDE